MMAETITTERVDLDRIPVKDIPPMEHIWPYPPGHHRPPTARALCGVSAVLDPTAGPTRPIDHPSRLCAICREEGRKIGLPV